AAGVAMGVIASPLFVRPLALAVSIVIGCLLPFGWQAWYLMRPRVRFAFGDWHSTDEMPPALSKRGRSAVTFAAVVMTLGLFGCSLLFAVETMMRSSGAYRIAMDSAQA